MGMRDRIIKALRKREAEFDRTMTKDEQAQCLIDALPDMVAPQWQPIETAPHGVDVLLYCPDMGCQTNRERIELGAYSTGRRIGGTSSMSYHSWATHWMPLPTPPEATP